MIHYIFLPLILGFIDWSEILKDAQATNRASVRHGEASVTLTYTPPKTRNDRDVVVEAKIQWLDEKIFEAYRFQSFADFPFAGKQTGPIDKSPWSYYVRDDLQVSFDGASKVIGIDLPNQRASVPLLDFHPWHAWFHCCPPQVSPGRPWSEMIGLVISDGAGQSSINEFHQIDPDHIRQIRREPDGYRVEIDFSLKQGGNVIRIESFPVPPSREISRGEYKWRPLGRTFVLDSCLFERTYPRTTELEVYRLKVQSVNLKPVDPAEFSKAHLMSLMPSGRIQVNDRANGRYGPVSEKSGVADGQLRSLSDTLRSRGFAKPN